MWMIDIAHELNQEIKDLMFDQALKFDIYDIVRSFYEHGIIPKSYFFKRSQDEKLPLQTAIENHSILSIKVLCEIMTEPCFIDQLDIKTKDLILDESFKYDILAAFQRLYEKDNMIGIEFLRSKKNGKNPLETAIANNCTDLVKALCKYMIPLLKDNKLDDVYKTIVLEQARQHCLFDIFKDLYNYSLINKATMKKYYMDSRKEFLELIIELDFPFN